MTAIADILDLRRVIRMTELTGTMRTVAGLSEPLRSAVIARMARDTRPATRKAVIIAGNMVTQWSYAGRSEILRAILTAQPSRAAWAAALTVAWFGGSSSVVAAARTRKGLGIWLDHARLWEPLPFLTPNFTPVSELPESVEIYRGGLVGTPEAIEGGYSWTAHAPVACLYARLRTLETGLAPVVVKATTPRSMIKLVTATRDREVVLTTPPDDVAVLIDDPEEIARLAEQEAATRGTVESADALLLDRHDDGCWHGWQG